MIDAIKDDVFRLGGGIVRRWLAAHGLSDLPDPRFLTADTAEMWEPRPDGSYTKIVYNASPSGIVRALEKGFLLAPPSEVPAAQGPRTPVDATVEPQAARAEMAPAAEGKHEPQAKTILVCDVCKMEFKYRSLLKRHRTRHDQYPAA